MNTHLNFPPVSDCLPENVFLRFLKIFPTSVPKKILGKKVWNMTLVANEARDAE